MLEERERIFSPLYGMVDAGARAGLMWEKRRAVSRIYLDQAYAVVGVRRREALGLLWRAMCERPGMFFEGNWAGVVRRALF